MGWKHRKTFLEAQKALEENEFAAADQLLSEVLGSDAEHAEALLHRAYARLRAGRLDEALEDANRCVSLRPESGVMQMLKGEILTEKGDLMNAYQSLKTACALEKDNGRAFFQLGKVCCALNRRNEAADYFEVALQFERDYVMAQWMTKSF
jgi:predicted Zn-dependent protease